MPTPTVYLAGPELFFADGGEIITRKRELARRYGFAPAVHGGTLDMPDDPLEAGMVISAFNEDLMRGADAIIANVTPFRGISADVGTVYEIGFMCALGRHVFAYTNDPRSYYDRAVADYYAAPPVAGDDGWARGADGIGVEKHTMADNLMIDGGIIARNGVVRRPEGGAVLPIGDLSVFEACLAAARERILAALGEASD